MTSCSSKSRKNLMLSMTEPCRSTGSWGTRATVLCSSLLEMAEASSPPMVVRPLVGSRRPRRSWLMVVLPLPEGPSMPTIFPSGMCMVTPDRARDTPS